MVGPLGFSLAPYIRQNRTLYRWVKPFANWYADLSGYRKVGYKYDDLVNEEDHTTQKALGRLTRREAYDRNFRMKRASHASVLHDYLPKDQWTKPEEDVRYLKPHVVDIVKEDAERSSWDNLHVERK